MKPDRPDRRTVLKAGAAGLAAGGLVPLLSRSSAFARDPADVFERRLEERRKLAIHRGCRYLAGKEVHGRFGKNDKAGLWEHLFGNRGFPTPGRVVELLQKRLDQSD